MSTAEELAIGSGRRYAVRQYPGVAFWYDGPQLSREWQDDDVYTVETGMVLMVMVGDDRRHVIDPEDITELSDDDYCPGCGQIGCKAYG
jgi:hypothetical protein